MQIFLVLGAVLALTLGAGTMRFTSNLRIFFQSIRGINFKFSLTDPRLSFTLVYRLDNNSNMQVNLQRLLVTVYVEINGEWQNLAVSRPSNQIIKILPNTSNPLEIPMDVPVKNLFLQFGTINPLQVGEKLKNGQYRIDTQITTGTGAVITDQSFWPKTETA